MGRLVKSIEIFICPKWRLLGVSFFRFFLRRLSPFVSVHKPMSLWCLCVLLSGFILSCLRCSTFEWTSVFLSDGGHLSSSKHSFESLPGFLLVPAGSCLVCFPLILSLAFIDRLSPVCACGLSCDPASVISPITASPQTPSRPDESPRLACLALCALRPLISVAVLL